MIRRRTMRTHYHIGGDGIISEATVHFGASSASRRTDYRLAQRIAPAMRKGRIKLRYCGLVQRESSRSALVLFIESDLVAEGIVDGNGARVPRSGYDSGASEFVVPRVI